MVARAVTYVGKACPYITRNASEVLVVYGLL